MGRGGSRGSREFVEVEDISGEGEYVVVCHVVLVTIVVELDVGLAVVRGVDVELVVEDVGTGVSGIDVGHEGRRWVGGWDRHYE